VLKGLLNAFPFPKGINTFPSFVEKVSKQHAFAVISLVCGCTPDQMQNFECECRLSVPEQLRQMLMC